MLIDPALLIKLAVLTSLMLVVAAIGMETRLSDLTAFLRAPGQAVRAMAAMFIGLPLVALALALLLPLDRATIATLVALSVSPMPPVFPGKASKQGAGSHYVMSLFVLASAVTFVMAPFVLALDSRILGLDLPFDAAATAKTLALTIALPLGAGLLLGQLAPAVAARVQPWFARIGGGLLAGAVLVILVSAFPAVRAAIGNYTLLSVALLAALGLVIGHLLGGPDPGNRAALATAVSLRHPGVALPLATLALPDARSEIAGTVILYLLAASLVGLGYSRLMKPS